jgi:hypothetical protein
MVIRASSIGGIPFGDNSGRPANPGTGQPYFNGESQRLELYTGAQYGWQNIVAETPGITGYTGSVLESNSTNTINIVGTNFAVGATAALVGNDGTEYVASSTVVQNLTLITATFGSLPVSKEPYDIRVTNPSNLYGVYYDILTVNDRPVWQTSSGSLGTFKEQTSISLTISATDDESNTITYSLASGSSLPSGISLNSSTGLISGTLPDIFADTTYTFTVEASDSLNTSSSRTFSITSLVTIPTEYLVVGGGGGGGGVTVGGGGGAGGMLTGTMQVVGGTTCSLYVGQGGTGVLTSGTDATNGFNSTLLLSGESQIIAYGGGAGGNYSGGPQPAASRNNGSNGGSGGGGGDTGRIGGTGVSGQGNNGGSSGTQWRGGGGGGAGSVGGSATTGQGGSGGNGLQSSITGTATYYAGGGGGCSDSAGGDAGLGGGGLGGGNSPSRNPTSGAPNTGGGGGGARDYPSSGPGANGGSGVIVLAYPNTYPPITTIPGTLTYDQPTRSGYRVYRFTNGSGTVTF